jgi:hypothetical protein
MNFKYLNNCINKNKKQKSKKAKKMNDEELKKTYTFLELSDCKYNDKLFDDVKFISEGDNYLGELYSCLSGKRIIFMDETTKKIVEIVNFGDGKI